MTNPEVVRIKSGRMMFLSKRRVCNGEKLKVLNEQETKGLFIDLAGVKTPFLSYLCIKNPFLWKCKMDAIIYAINAFKTARIYI